MLKLYIIGIAILVIAILANGIIVKIGLKSWYDFIELLSKQGTYTLSKITILDYLWLFFGYPLVLGLGYWLGEKIHQALFL